MGNLTATFSTDESALMVQFYNHSGDPHHVILDPKTEKKKQKLCTAERAEDF